MGSLIRWMRTTFDYNPSFPLSALALLAGLKLLAGDGGADPHDLTVLEGALGLGILQAYELALLGTVLLFLWPRRIAHEANISLIVFGVVRCAAPFVVIGLAADGELMIALGFGAALWGLMAVKTRVLINAFQLDLRRWERGLDVALYGVACVGLPLLAHQLSAATGLGISYQTARILLIAACWLFAAALAPLCLGLTGPRSHALLQSHPAIVWRVLTGLGAAALLLSALWLAGDAPPLIALLPLGLIALALATRVTVACGRTAPAWVIHAPATLAALVVLVRPETLMGNLPVLPQPLLVLGFLIAAGLSLPLIDPARARRGLMTLSVVAAIAPLKFVPSPVLGEQYLLCAALVLAGLGWVRRHDALLTHGALAAALLGLHLGWGAVDAEVITQLVIATGSALAIGVALRMPELGVAGRAATGLVVGGSTWLAAAQVPSLQGVLIAALAGASLGLLAWRLRARPLRFAAAYAAGVVALRKVGGGLDPGVALILIAFAGLPAGSWIAIQRERRLARERDADPPHETGPALEIAGVREAS